MDKFDKSSFRVDERVGFHKLLYARTYVCPSKIGGRTKMFYNWYVIVPLRL